MSDTTLTFTQTGLDRFQARDAASVYVIDHDGTFGTWSVTVKDPATMKVLAEDGGIELLDTAKDLATAYSLLGDDYTADRMTMAVFVAYGMSPVVVDVLLALEKERIERA